MSQPYRSQHNTKVIRPLAVVTAAKYWGSCCLQIHAAFSNSLQRLVLEAISLQHYLAGAGRKDYPTLPQPIKITLLWLVYIKPLGVHNFLVNTLSLSLLKRESEVTVLNLDANTAREHGKQRLCSKCEGPFLFKNLELPQMKLIGCGCSTVYR